MAASSGCAGRRPAPGAEAERPDPTAPARAAFGDALEAYHGHPLAEMAAAFGPPASTKAMADGGSVTIWERQGETAVDAGKPVKLDCRITVIADGAGLVTGVFGGGSTLFCAREFPPVQGPVLPPLAGPVMVPPPTPDPAP